MKQQGHEPATKLDTSTTGQRINLKHHHPCHVASFKMKNLGEKILNNLCKVINVASVELTYKTLLEFIKFLPSQPSLTKRFKSGGWRCGVVSSRLHLQWQHSKWEWDRSWRLKVLQLQETHLRKQLRTAEVPGALTPRR